MNSKLKKTVSPHENLAYHRHNFNRSLAEIQESASLIAAAINQKGDLSKNKREDKAKLDDIIRLFAEDITRESGFLRAAIAGEEAALAQVEDEIPF